MSSTKMTYASKGSGRGKRRIGFFAALSRAALCRRRLLMMTAMMAAFAALMVASLLSVRAFADSTKTYIITYTMPDGDSVTVSEEHNGLPSQTLVPDGDNVIFTTMPSTTRQGLTFRAWRYGTGISAFYEPSDGSFTASVSHFKREGNTDNYVLNLKPYWVQPCRVTYISEGSVYHTKDFNIEAGNTSHESFSASKPAHSSPDDYAFVGWELTGNGSKVVPWSQLPYTTESQVEYSWFNTSTGCSSYYESTDGTVKVWEVNLYAVWTPKIAVTYKDTEVNYTSDPVKVDPQKFNLMDKNTLLTAEKNTGNRPLSYPDYNLYKNAYRLVWNTDPDYTGTAYSGSETEFRSDMTLYAQWNIEYEVYYYIRKDDGTYPTTQNFVKMFQQPKDASADTRYYFVNDKVKTGYEITGWSTQPDGDGTDYVTIADFPEEITGTNNRRRLNVYGHWTPQNYTFIFDLQYMVDGETGQTIDQPITNLPDGYDPVTHTVTLNYEQIPSGGYLPGTPSAAGYQFKGWKYDSDGRLLGGTSGRSDIPRKDIADSHDNTVYIYAVWHRYNRYTFLYDYNAGVYTVRQNNTDVQTGLVQTHYGRTFTGQYQSAADAALNALLYNSETEKWEDVFYQTDLKSRKNPDNTSYYKIARGDLTAKGYEFMGWDLTYYKANGTSDVTMEYDGVTYHYDSQHHFYSKADCDGNGVYTSWLQESKGDMLFVFTARWKPKFGIVYDKNVPENQVSSITSFDTSKEANIYELEHFGSGRASTGFDAAKPERTGYKFFGWSYDSTLEPSADVEQHKEETGTLCSNKYESDPWVFVDKCTELTDDCFRARVYAIWEPLYTHTFIYELNRPDLKQDDYPQGSYLGKDDASLTDAMWNATRETWTEILNENDIKDESRYFKSGNKDYLRMKNGLLKSDHYLFRGWEVKSFTRKLKGTETDENKVLILPDTETFPGRYELSNHIKTLTVTDAESVVGLFGNWFKGSNGAAGEPTVTYLRAIWEPRRVFILRYHKNLGGEGKPAAEDYIGDDVSGGENQLGELAKNEAGEWEDILEEEGISSHLFGGYYPLKHNKLQAKGYKFVGWDMYYYRKANNEQGKRLAGPYKYRINNSGGFNTGYGIYGSWFNRNDAVDMEFDLYAVWEPQYEVFFHEGVDDAHLPEVSDMPEPKYSGIIRLNHWRGSGTKVIRAKAPKRTGYYFVGWSTRNDLDVDNSPEDINYVLHRNHLGSSVPKSACSNPQYNEIDEGYLRADLYAVWSAKPIYSIYYDENADGETYPNIEYLGAVSGKKEPDPWTVRLTEEQARAIPGRYYEFDKEVVLAAKGYKFTGWHLTYMRGAGFESNTDYKLIGGRYGIYKNWITATECPDLQFFVSANWEPQYKVNFYDGDTLMQQSALVQQKHFRGSSKVFKLSGALPTRANKYFVGWSTDPDYDFETNGTDGLFRGTRNVNILKSAFRNADYNDTDQGFLRADLYAVFGDKPVYYILYDPNEEGLENDPFLGEYIGADEDMVWDTVITQDELDEIRAENRGYPLQRGNLKAKGYVFTGWQLTYTRKSGSEIKKDYPVTAPDSSFKIYPTWFDDTNDYEFVLTAQWKPQFAAKFLPNAGNDTVTGMPDFEYTPLKEERRFTGNPATAVFAASVPKRAGWYFAGWSTDPDYNVDTQGLSGLLRRNHIGPSVPKNACVNALYSDTAPYDYKGFMCAYLYAVWSPHPVYQIVYDPNEDALTSAGGEFISADSMRLPAEKLVDGQWVFLYTRDDFQSLLSANGNYYPLIDGNLKAKGHVFTGWTFSSVKANGNPYEKFYDVSHQNTFKVPKSTFDDTGDYQFLLTANWEPRYSVAFHENAGSDTVTNMPSGNPSGLFKASDFNREGTTRIFSDKGADTSKPPQREGYVFLGWSTDENAASAATLLTRTTSGVVVALSDCSEAVEDSFRAHLYAVWTSGHSVSYELTGVIPDGVSELPETKDYPTDTENISVAPDMTAPGHAFSHWSVRTAPDGFSVSDGKFTMPDGDVVFTGSFTPNSHNVIYKVGETVHGTKPFSYGAEVTVGSGVTDPTRTDAVFKGWRYQSGLSGESAITDGRFTMPDNDVVFEAVFEDTYQVSYAAKKDGADYPLPAAYNPERFAKDASVTVKPVLPDIDGYTFSGWRVGSPSGVTVTGGKFTMPADNVALYGEYIKNTHNVIYKVGETVHDTKPFSYGAEVTVGSGVTDPTRTDAVFKGWRYQSGLSGESAITDGRFTMPDNDVVFEAVFEDTYQVSYVAKKNGADYPLPAAYNPERFAKNTSVTVKPVLPDIDGYTFSGWRVGSPSGVTVTGGKFTMPAGDVVLVGEYTVKRAKVIYYDFDDSIIGDAQTYPVHREVTRGLDGSGNKITPEHDGFVFVGWEIKDQSIDESAIDENGRFIMPENDVKFRAAFDQKIRLIYDPNGREADQVPADDEFTVKAGGRVTRQLDSEVIPKCENAVFRYWSAAPDGEAIKDVTVSYRQSGLELADGRFNVRVYAIWAQKYTVRYQAYDVNGSEITLDSAVYGDRQYPDGEEVALAPGLTHDEYFFDGWKVSSPEGLDIIQSAGGEKTFTMPASDVLLTGRFVDEAVEPVEYTITYRSGLEQTDEGYTADLGQPHDFRVTADENGKANHKVLANDAPELKYVREGYEFAGWKLTKAQPEPNPAPGGKGTVVAPRAFAADGLISGGDVITVESSVVLTAQWTKKPAPEPDKPSSPGTGESEWPTVIALNLAIISMLAIGAVFRKRRAA